MEGGTLTKKERRYTLVTNHCVVNVAMNFFNKNVLHRLNVDHLKLLFNTPFLHLFVIPNKVHTSNAILHCILTRWDHKKNCFNFNNKVSNFTSDDVSHIMCLPSTGDRVNLVHKRDSSSTASMLRRRYFPNMVTIKKIDLEEAITNALDLDDPVEDVVSLLVLYLFTTVLLPNTGDHVPLHLFKYAERLGELKKYNWGEAVYELLEMHIPNCALWCQIQDLDEGDYGPEVDKKKGKEKEEDEDAVPLRKPSQHMPGCCLALIVWFFEVTKFNIAKDTSGHVPRYLDWYKGVSERKERTSFERYLGEIKISQIRKEMTHFDRDFERSLKEKGFVAAKHLDYILNEEKFRTTLNTPTYQMLVELTPIFMKFGIVPCNLLKKEVGKLNPKIVYFEKTFSKHKDLEEDEIEKLCKVDDLQEDEIVYSANNCDQNLDRILKRKMEEPNSKEGESQEKRSKKRHDKLEGEGEESDQEDDNSDDGDDNSEDEVLKEQHRVAVDALKELAHGRRGP